MIEAGMVRVRLHVGIGKTVERTIDVRPWQCNQVFQLEAGS
jgi:hypothetical protein